jgi:hypothetical protein
MVQAKTFSTWGICLKFSGTPSISYLSILGLSIPGLSIPGFSVPGLSIPGLSVPGLASPPPKKEMSF